MAWARSTSVGQHQKLSHPIHLLSPWIYIPSANSKKSQAFCRLRSLSPSKSRQCSFASCRADGSSHVANPHPVIVLDFDGARWPLHRQNHCRRQCHPSQAAKLTVMKPLTPALPPHSFMTQPSQFTRDVSVCSSGLQPAEICGLVVLYIQRE